MSEDMLHVKQAEEGSQSLLTDQTSDESSSSNSAEGEAVVGDVEERGAGMLVKSLAVPAHDVETLAIRVNPSDNSTTTLEMVLQQSGVDTKIGDVLQNLFCDETTVIVKLLKPSSAYDVVEDFLSEVAMYRSTLQFFQKTLPHSDVLGMFSKCFHISDNALILEDLVSIGFKPSAASLGLQANVDTLQLALKTLGRFHALSLAAKKAEPAGFRRHIVRRLRRQGRVHNSKENQKEYATAYFSVLSAAAMEPIERLGTDSSVDQLRELLHDIPCLIRQLLSPREPLAVLCHGQYDPVKLYLRGEHVKLVDFQMVHYGSPAVDLSALLFLNAGHVEDWDALLEVYHGALEASLQYVEVPGLEVIRREFITMAPYGYIVATGIVRSRQELAEDNNRLTSLARRLLHYVALDQYCTKL